MIKKIIFSISFIFLLSFNCYAEGQDGFNSIFNFFYLVWAGLCIILFTAMGGLLSILIGRILRFPCNNYIKIFGISFVLSTFIVIVAEEEFLIGIWNLF